MRRSQVDAPHARERPTKDQVWTFGIWWFQLRTLIRRYHGGRNLSNHVSAAFGSQALLQ